MRCTGLVLRMFLLKWAKCPPNREKFCSARKTTRISTFLKANLYIVISIVMYEAQLTQRSLSHDLLDEIIHKIQKCDCNWNDWISAMETCWTANVTAHSMFSYVEHLKEFLRFMFFVWVTTVLTSSLWLVVWCFCYIKWTKLLSSLQWQCRFLFNTFYLKKL